MEKLRKKKAALCVAGGVCKFGGTWMLIVTVCQMAAAAERGTVGGFVLGMLAALACGLCAMLLWSYAMDLDMAARRVTQRMAKAQAREMYRQLRDVKPGEMREINWKKCG